MARARVSDLRVTRDNNPSSSRARLMLPDRVLLEYVCTKDAHYVGGTPALFLIIF